MSVRRNFAVVLACCLAAGCGKKDDSPSPAPTTTPTAPKMATSADEIPGIDMAGAQKPNEPKGLPAPDDVAAPPADAQKTASGLASKVLAKGTGTAKPGPQDKVKVNYTGWTKDGKMFDSSVVRGQPASFGVSQVIPGWTEGLQLMTVGEKRRFWIPASLAYGDTPRGGAPAGQLTFDVELLEIAKPPATPSDVKAPPANATKLPDGLAYRILTPSKDPNAPKPGPTSVVSVKYAGWTTDGKMFDSSDDPVTFPLNRVIKGWTEGLQQLKVGDKARLWIPKELAYEDPSRPPRPGAPKGMLVFDVELLDTKEMPQRPGMPGQPPPH